MTFHIDLEADPTLAGAMLARVRELPELSTSLRGDENPLPVIQSLIASFFQDMVTLGRLEEVLAKLGHAAVGASPSQLVAEYILHGSHEIRL